MAEKSIRKNYIYNVCYQCLLLIAPLITTPHVSRALGADGVGAVSYAGAIVSYFTLFGTLGISTYGQREISYVRGSRERRSEVFWNTKLLEFCTSGLVLILYILFTFSQKEYVVYLLFVFNILAVFVDVTWFFQGLEEFGKIVFRNVVFKVINIVYIFVAVRDEEDVWLYVLGLSLFTFLSNVSLWKYLPGYLCRVKRKNIKPFRDIKVVISLFIPTVAIQVYTILDKTMIGLITRDSSENGYYEQALKISRMVLMVVTALGTVMVPRIGYCFKNEQAEDIRRLMYRGYRFVWFLGIPLCAGLILVSDNLVPWFFGPGYEKVITLLKILALLVLAVGINNVTGVQYLIPTKRQNLFTFTVMAGAAVNFLLNIILIGNFKSVGAAIASVTAEMVIAAVQLVLVRKELSPQRVVREGTHYAIAGGIMSVVLWVMGKQMAPSFLNTIILVLSGGCIYFAVLIFLRDEFFLSNVRRMLESAKKQHTRTKKNRAN